MFKQTKIVATVSDRRCDPAFIRLLHENGANVFRLNTAHQSPEDTLRVISNIRSVTQTCAILIDTKGPEIRTAGLKNTISVQAGQVLRIGPAGSDCDISTNCDSFCQDVPEQARILMDDGSISFEVCGKKDGMLLVRAEHEGQVENRKTINVPGVHISLPALTQKDRDYVRLACEHGIDFIAHSFVRNQQDVLEVKRLIAEHKGRVKVIAKIENREGVDNIEEIIKESYGIMIARGDLGIELPAEEVPIIQKKIIARCIQNARPVITATQFLHSMIENPRPTRAEVSDIANAVYDSTDAVMLSGETAYGKYPIEAIRTMQRIVTAAEAEQTGVRDLPVFGEKNPLRNYLAKAAIQAARELPVKALVIDTETGTSARIVSAYRGAVPVYAQSPSMHVVRELSLSYGIKAGFLEATSTTDELVASAIAALLEKGAFDRDDLIVVLAGTPGNSQGSNFIEINTAGRCLEGRRE